MLNSKPALKSKCSKFEVDILKKNRFSLGAVPHFLQ